MDPRQTGPVGSDQVSARHSATFANAGLADALYRLCRAGPMLLGLVIGLNLAFWAFGHWLHRKPPAELTAQLTLIGSGNLNPDHDFVIYLLGLLLSVALALGLSATWHHGFARSTNYAQTRRLAIIAGLHLPVALGLVLARQLRPDFNMLSLLSAGLGLVWCAGALWLARQRAGPTGASHAPTPTPLPHRAGPPTDKASPWGWLVELVCIPVLVVLLVWLPRVDDLVALSYRLDHFHHPDYYAVAPALALRHGVALGTDFYAQYGVGWPMVLALFAEARGYLSYQLFFEMCVAWGCIYFLSVYLFLRVLLRSATWALAGMLLAIGLSLFGGLDASTIKWVWPSSTALRYAMDMVCFTVLLAHARTGRMWLALPAGCCTGLALLLGVDTGLYLLVALVVYAALNCLPHTSLHGSAAGIRFVGIALPTCAGVLLGGLSWASQGTIGHAAFWLGWTESLRVYGGGFSHLPVGTAIAESRAAYGLFAAMLLVYLQAVTLALQAAAVRRLTPETLLLGLVAFYGLETLLLFVGRSHRYNLCHPAIPFCVVLTCFVAHFSSRLPCATEGHPAKSWRLALNWVLKQRSVVGVVFVAVGLGLSQGYRSYPSILHEHRQVYEKAPASTTLSAVFVTHRESALGTAADEEARQFRAVVAALRELSDHGRRTVALIGMKETAYLLEADIAPYFRYSPVLMNMVFHQQTRSLLDQMAEAPPDYLLLPTLPEQRHIGQQADDTQAIITEAVQRLFVLDRTVEDLAVYRRRESP